MGVVISELWLIQSTVFNGELTLCVVTSQDESL